MIHSKADEHRGPIRSFAQIAAILGTRKRFRGIKTELVRWSHDRAIEKLREKLGEYANDL